MINREQIRQALTVVPEHLQTQMTPVIETLVSLLNPTDSHSEQSAQVALTQEVTQYLSGKRIQIAGKVLEIRHHGQVDRMTTGDVVGGEQVTVSLYLSPVSTQEASLIRTRQGLFQVPHRFNPHYQDPHGVLGRLHQSLQAEQTFTVLTQIQALHGLGGVGKTQSAAQYAHLHRADYQDVIWIHADEQQDLTDQFAKLCVSLELQEKRSDNTKTDAQTGLQELNHSSVPRLLIFDNVDTVEKIREWIPTGQGVRVVLTSRIAHWPRGGDLIEIDVLDEHSAVRFLTEVTHQPMEKEAAQALAVQLGCLPLALEQAAAYLRETQESFAQYLEDVEEARSKVFSHQIPGATKYPEALALTWQVSFERLSDLSQILLRLSSVLAADTIPIRLFEEQTEQLQPLLGNPETGESEEQVDCTRRSVRQALAQLSQYSLISLQEDQFSVHRLVQAVLYNQMSPEERHQTLQAAVKLGDGLFPGEVIPDVNCWSVCAELLPHSQSLGQYVDKEQPLPSMEGRLFDRTATYLQFVLEDLDASRQQFERALRIDEANYGEDHPKVATRINNLGMVLKAQGDLDTAKKCFERALRIDEANYGESHPKIATIVNNQGLVMKAQGNLEGAKHCFARALRIAEANCGQNHHSVTSIVNNLGLVLKAQGNLEGAQQCFERALRIDEANYGEDHPEVATRVNNLGGVLQARGILDAAQQCFERALRINEANYGEDHPKVATIVNNLGLVLQAQGNLEGAQQCFERALRIDEANYGEDHPEVATDVSNLGGVLQAQGDLDTARQYFERALRIGEANYGQNHPNVAIRLSNLGSLLQEQADLSGARGCFERALEIRLSFLGADHPTTQLVQRKIDQLS